MECPFCAEDIKDEALVCKHCSRDLKITRPLIEENEELIAQLDELQQEVHGLRVDLERIRQPRKFWGSRAVKLVLPTVLLLLIAHYVIIVRFDINPLYLRLVSTLIPLPFGFVLRFFFHNGFKGAAVFGLVTGFLAVMGMLTVIGYTDNVPIIPDTLRDWRETVEYMLSIALAGVTGSLLALVAHRLLNKSLSTSKQPNAMAMTITRILWPHVGAASIRRRAEQVESIIQTLTASGAAIGTAAGSVYTGVRALIPSISWLF